MASITQQKADLKDILLEHILRVYAEASEDEREQLVVGLAARLMAKMTLSELRAWNQKIAISMWMKEKREGAEE